MIVKIYRQYSKYDCSSTKPVINKKYRIKGFNEPYNDNFIQVVGFIDEDDESFVNIPNGSVIEIDKVQYEIVRGELFTLNENREKALTDPSKIFFKDDCILDSKNNKLNLRNFVKKYAILKKVNH